MNCVSLLLMGTLASAQPGAKRVAVFDLTPTHVKPSIAAGANAVLRSLLKKWERGSEILAPGTAADCAIVECFVSLGKDMAAKEIVAGRLSSLGKTLVLELQRIDVEQNRAMGTTVRTVKNNEDALFGAIKDSLEELYRAERPSGAAPSAKPGATGRPRTLQVTGFEDTPPGTKLYIYGDPHSRTTAEIVDHPVHGGNQAFLYDAETHDYAGAIVPLSSKEADWTGMTTLKFWVYGKATARRFDLLLEDADREFFIKNLKDDFDGWKQVTVPLADIAQRRDYQISTAKTNGKIDYPLISIQIVTDHRRGGEGNLTLAFDDFEVTAD